MADGTPVTLSIIVTIVEGDESLRRCLSALQLQEEPPASEIIVPCDDTVSGVEALRQGFPGVRFLEIGRVSTSRPAGWHAWQHELYDRRRAAGLAAARGELVAMVEDRVVPRADWARKFALAHASQPYAVIGGAIVNGCTAVFPFAAALCDFGRYEPPFRAGPAGYVSDVNVCYKRWVLDSTRELWQERYHETTVHWALRARGETLWLTPEPQVEQRRSASGVGWLLAERFHWGRLFAHTRSREEGAGRRVLRTLTAPLLPIVMFARLLPWPFRQRRGAGRFLLAAPAIVLLLVAWSAGEAVGYITGRP